MERAQRLFIENRSRQLWKKARRALYMSRFLQLWQRVKRPAEFSNLEIRELMMRGDDEGDGMVYKVVDRITGAIYALKEFNCNSEQREDVYREIQFLKQLHHPNLVKIHQELLEISDQKIYLLLEYMDGGNLLGTNVKDETYLACVAHQVLLGLDYLHQNNISHGDFKTSNIFVNSLKQVKITYFGKFLSKTPPLLDYDRIGNIYEKYSWDVWNVGLSILKLYNGSFANLGCVDPHEAFNFKSDGSHELNVPQETFNLKASKDLWSFLLCCMHTIALRRWMLAELIHHPFIEHHSKSSIKQKEHFFAAPSTSLSCITQTTYLPSRGVEQNTPNKRPKIDVEDEKSIYHTENTTNPTKVVAIRYPDCTSLQVYNRCTQYCSLFPKDFEFEMDKLIQLWIAEECFDVEVERIEDVAKTYFNMLVEKEDILPSKCDHLYGKMEYKVNPSKSVKIEDGYLRIDEDNLDEIPGTTLHLSLHHKMFDKTTFDVLKKCKQLLTLLLGDCGSSIERLPNDLFLHLKLLRTLDLSFSHLSELPGSIGHLESLRYLDVSETPIKVLPESTDRLYFLQTLRLKGCFGVHALPKEFKKLINLRHLDLDIVPQLKSMPKGMGSLVNLRTLSAFLVGKNGGCGIGELKKLNNITGSFCISRLENVRNAYEAKDAAMGGKKYIEKLEFRWSGHGNESSETEIEILEHLQPHFGLKELQILFYSGEKLPSWISNPSFAELASITLYECINCHILPSIGELPCLKFLSIVGMSSVIDIDSLFCRNHGSQGSNAFPRLEKLTLDSMANLEKWTGLKDGDFPCLRHISIRYCLKLSVLPVLSHLHALQYLEISHCMELVSLPEGGLPSSLESLIIRECPRINERCCKDEGQDWFKIAHVRNIWIDFSEISLD